MGTNRYTWIRAWCRRELTAGKGAPIASYLEHVFNEWALGFSITQRRSAEHIYSVVTGIKTIHALSKWYLLAYIHATLLVAVKTKPIQITHKPELESYTQTESYK